MAKIKVGELRELHKTMAEDITTHDFFGLQIEIKPYIPFLEKIKLVSSIYESAVNRDDGLHIIDYNSLSIAFKTLFLETYTNLTLPKNTIESYDIIQEIGLFDFVYDKLSVSERIELRQALDDFIDKKRDEYDQKNTIQYIIKNGLSKLIEKTPNETQLKELIANAKEEFSNLDINKMNFLKAAIGWNNGVEK